MRTCTLFSFALTILMAAGCARPARLVPGPEATHIGRDRRLAVEEIEGVRMVARGDAWRGDSRIEEHVTPLRLRIENDSGQPLRIRYDAFALISDTGERYTALPPILVEEVAEELEERDHRDPRYRHARAPFRTRIRTPAFYHRHFYIAPYYRSYYPDMRVVQRRFMYDPVYYRHYYGYWVDTPLPTEEMLENAIPEGILDHGGSLDGFLYFEPVDRGEESVTFRADIVFADDGRIPGAISIPFDVE